MDNVDDTYLFCSVRALDCLCENEGAFPHTSLHLLEPILVTVKIKTIRKINNSETEICLRRCVTFIKIKCLCFQHLLCLIYLHFSRDIRFTPTPQRNKTNKIK